MSDVLLEMVHQISPHGKWLWLVHVQLYQLLFIMCWPCSYVIDEKDIIFWYLNITLNPSLFYLVTPCEPHWVTSWNRYHLLMLLIILVLLVFAYFITWTIATGFTNRLYICTMIWNWFIFTEAFFSIFLVGPYSDHYNPFYQRILRQWSWYSVKYDACYIYMLAENHGEWYIIHTGHWLIHFYSEPP